MSTVGRDLLDTLERDYDVKIRADRGWADWMPRRIRGEKEVWTIDELETVVEAVRDLAEAMGGADSFRAKLRGVVLKQRVMRAGGLGMAHSITMNDAGFTKWPVVHELGHAWDGVNGWRLSRDMQEELGAGFARPTRHLFDRNNPADWYDPGDGPPPCGLDQNFNRKEDFAEAVAAFVYPDQAQQNAVARGWPYVDPARGYDYDGFHATPRGKFIGALLIAQP